MNIILIYFAKKYHGDWDAIYKALEEKEKVSLAELNALEEEIKTKGWNIITILDIDYPTKLKEAYKPPFVMWYKGDKSLLNNQMIAFTGDTMNDKTQELITKFVPEIEANHAIITTLTSDVDHEIVEVSKKPTVFVGSQGISTLDMNDEDLFITEYPDGTTQNRKTSMQVGRIVGAFAKSLILVQTDVNGPSIRLVTNFLNLGKEVYCFPYSDGNSQLIKQGANLITNIKDLHN